MTVSTSFIKAPVSFLLCCLVEEVAVNVRFTSLAQKFTLFIK